MLRPPLRQQIVEVRKQRPLEVAPHRASVEGAVHESQQRLVVLGLMTVAARTVGPAQRLGLAEKLVDTARLQS